MVGVGKAQLLQLGHFGKDPIFDLPLELELRQAAPKRLSNIGYSQHAVEAVSPEGSDRPVRPCPAAPCHRPNQRLSFTVARARGSPTAFVWKAYDHHHIGYSAALR